MSAPIVKSIANDPAWKAYWIVVDSQPTVAGKLAMAYDERVSATLPMRNLATRLILEDAVAPMPDGQSPADVLMAALLGRKDANRIGLKTLAGDTIQAMCPLADGSPGTLSLDDALSQLAAVDQQAASIIANLAIGAAALHDEEYSHLIWTGFKARAWFVIDTVLQTAGNAVAAAVAPLSASPIIIGSIVLGGLYLLTRLRRD